MEKGRVRATSNVTHHIGIEWHHDSTFTAPEIPDSKLPALLGGLSLRNHNALIDKRNDCMYTVGPGGYRIELSPGSKRFPLERSENEHLMLPCSRFGGQQRQQRTEDSQTFVVGEYFVVKGEAAQSPLSGVAPSVNLRRRQRDLRAASSESS